MLSFADTIEDAAGNAIEPKTESLTVNQDNVAPEVVDITYTNATTVGGTATPNGAIIVQFNEPVTTNAAAADYVLVQDDGTPVAPPASVFIHSEDETLLVLELAAGVAQGVESYTVVLPDAAVDDLSIGANSSESVNLTVDVSDGAPTAPDSTAPVVASVSATAATSSTSGTTIDVTFTEAGSGLDASTVINTNNYRLDGAPLPGGSYITLAGNTATINIPAGKIPEDKVYALNINGIADRAGNVMAPYVNTTDVDLDDDIRPELTAATLNANGSISLSFSEAVVPATGNEADFEVVVDGDTLTGGFTLADGSGSEAGNYILTVQVFEEGIAADPAGSVTDPNGDTYTGSANNVMRFEFFDADGSGSFNAGDIVLSFEDTGAATAIPFGLVGDYDLNDAETLVVRTISNPILVTDTGAIGNPVKGNKSIKLK